MNKKPAAVTPVQSDATAPPTKPASHVQSKTRSPNYPSISLETAVTKLNEAFQQMKRHQVGVEIAVRSMNLSYRSSSGKLALAAMRAFGLFENVGLAMVKISTLGLDIAADYKRGSAEWLKAVKESAIKPKIHQTLWELYGAELPPEDEIRRYLIRELKFNDNAVGPLIAEYKRTIGFAKLTEDGTIQGGDGAPIEESEANEMDNPNLQQGKPKNGHEPNRSGGFSPPKTPPGTRDFPLYTSKSKGTLYVPEQMTEKDFELLELQIKNSLAIIRATAIVAEG